MKLRDDMRKILSWIKRHDSFNKEYHEIDFNKQTFEKVVDWTNSVDKLMCKTYYAEKIENFYMDVTLTLLLTPFIAVAHLISISFLSIVQPFAFLSDCIDYVGRILSYNVRSIKNSNLILNIMLLNKADSIIQVNNKFKAEV
ncbi:hypothetical protein OAR19_00735 [bacterium]|nr:hypothetical protein [bacterium]